MIYTESMRDEITNTTHEEQFEVEVPDDVVDAIAARLDMHDDLDQGTARDLTHDHVETSTRFVTADGANVVDEALERAENGLELTYNESDDSDALEVSALARIDPNADHPLSIEVPIPAAVLSSGRLEDVLDAVTIDATVVDEEVVDLADATGERDG